VEKRDSADDGIALGENEGSGVVDEEAILESDILGIWVETYGFS
jgi:hypothetical protein